MKRFTCCVSTWLRNRILTKTKICSVWNILRGINCWLRWAAYFLLCEKKNNEWICNSAATRLKYPLLMWGWVWPMFLGE